MLHRIGSVIEAGLRCIPARLIGDPQRDRLLTIDACLGAAVRSAAFECRLDDQDTVDFNICLEKPASFRTLSAPEAWHAFDERTKAFLELWSSRCNSVNSSVARIWLEFDSGPRGMGPPFAYFSPEPNASIESMFDCLRLLRSKPIDRYTERSINSVLSALPPNGRTQLLATLESRGQDVTRVAVDLQASEAHQYLHDIDWPGDHNWVKRLFDNIDAAAWRTPLQLDFSPGLAADLSIEFVVADASRLKSDSWRQVFGYLECERACLISKRRAIETWIDEDVPGINKQLDIKCSFKRGQTFGKAYLVIEKRYPLLGHQVP